MLLGFLSKVKTERANKDKTRNKPLSNDCRFIYLVFNKYPTMCRYMCYISSAVILQNQKNVHLFLPITSIKIRQTKDKPYTEALH